MAWARQSSLAPTEIRIDEKLMDTVFLIHETNCYVSKPSLWHRLLFGFRLVERASCRDVSSLWIAFPPFDPDSSEYTTDATRLIGPASNAETAALILHLTSAFERAGVRAVLTHVADD